METDKTETALNEAQSQVLEKKEVQEASRCKICKSPIHAEAKKCTECGSFQNWRRHIVLSNTLLALVVALVSVSGALGPTIREMFRPIKSSIYIHVFDVSSNEINVVAGNSGTRPGLLKRARLSYGTIQYQPQPLKIVGPDPPIIPRDTMVHFSLHPLVSDRRARFHRVPGEKHPECDLEIQYAEFDGTEQSVLYKIPCPNN